jgi:DnaJ-class molecular chaperone
MSADTKCPDCLGQGFTTKRKSFIGETPGLHEIRCLRCNGTGCAGTVVEDELDDEFDEGVF